MMNSLSTYRKFANMDLICSNILEQCLINTVSEQMRMVVNHRMVHIE